MPEEEAPVFLIGLGEGAFPLFPYVDTREEGEGGLSCQQTTKNVESNSLLQGKTYIRKYVLAMACFYIEKHEQEAQETIKTVFGGGWSKSAGGARRYLQGVVSP